MKRKGSIKETRRLLDEGCDPNQNDREGNPLVHLAYSNRLKN
jgi:hypothetical protein